MLFLQIIISFCSTLPFGLQKIVSTLKPAKTAYQLAMESFVLCLTRHISFTNSTFCFFFYILTAEKFRREFMNCLQQPFSWIFVVKKRQQQQENRF
jgi:predicted phosphoadenosine phosphosulfate sulfurtransferase